MHFFVLIGPHFRCPVDKPVWMCFFYLIDALKVKKWRKIPAKVREYVGFAKTAMTTWKEILFPRHFVVRDAMDFLEILSERIGIGPFWDIRLLSKDWMEKSGKRIGGLFGRIYDFLLDATILG